MKQTKNLSYKVNKYICGGFIHNSVHFRTILTMYSKFKNV